MKGFGKIKRFWVNHQFLGYLIVFTVTFLFFFWLQYYPSFADPDSFYHTKMGMLFKERGIITDFPWLGNFTVLKDYYTDQHLGYHIFLAPFTFFQNPILGVKLATILLATLLVLASYWLFKSFRIKYAIFFSLFLLLISPFTFRISLAKAPAVSIIFLIVALYFLFKEKVWPLFILGILYVWTYGGFVLLIVFTVLYAIISNLFKKLSARKRLVRKRPWFQNNNFHQILASLGGIIVGLVINPFFPKNLYFYSEQLIKIGMINFQDKIGVGGEWYPYEFSTLVSNTALVIIFLVTAIVLSFIHYRKLSKRSVTLFLITLFFFILTLKSRRYVEYFVPFAVIYSTFSLNESLKKYSFKKLKKYYKEVFGKRKALALLILGYFVITVPYLIVRDLRANQNNLRSGIPYNKYEKSAIWLKANSQKGEIVLHSDWDDFPVLFYQNDHNNYIVGLDPTFMYSYNEDLYWKWVNITTGKGVDNLEKAVREDLKSSFVLVEKDHQAMDSLFNSNENFLKVYEDDEVRIYK